MKLFLVSLFLVLMALVQSKVIMRDCVAGGALTGFSNGMIVNAYCPKHMVATEKTCSAGRCENNRFTCCKLYRNSDQLHEVRRFEGSEVKPNTNANIDSLSQGEETFVCGMRCKNDKCDTFQLSYCIFQNVRRGPISTRRTFKNNLDNKSGKCGPGYAIAGMQIFQIKRTFQSTKNDYTIFCRQILDGTELDLNGCMHTPWANSNGNKKAECPNGMVATSTACKRNYCDHTMLKCCTVRKANGLPARMDKQEWSVQYSEERHLQPDTRRFNRHFICGFLCASGKNCDNFRVKYCTFEDLERWSWTGDSSITSNSNWESWTECPPNSAITVIRGVGSYSSTHKISCGQIRATAASLIVKTSFQPYSPMYVKVYFGTRTAFINDAVGVLMHESRNGACPKNYVIYEIHVDLSVTCIMLGRYFMGPGERIGIPALIEGYEKENYGIVDDLFSVGRVFQTVLGPAQSATYVYGRAVTCPTNHQVLIAINRNRVISCARVISQPFPTFDLLVSSGRNIRRSAGHPPGKGAWAQARTLASLLGATAIQTAITPGESSSGSVNTDGTFDPTAPTPTPTQSQPPGVRIHTQAEIRAAIRRFQSTVVARHFIDHHVAAIQSDWSRAQINAEVESILRARQNDAGSFNQVHVNTVIIFTSPGQVQDFYSHLRRRFGPESGDTFVGGVSYDTFEQRPPRGQETYNTIQTRRVSGSTSANPTYTNTVRNNVRLVLEGQPSQDKKHLKVNHFKGTRL